MDDVQQNVVPETQATETNSNTEIRNELKAAVLSLFKKIVFVAVSLFLIFGVIFGYRFSRNQWMAPNIKEGDILLFYRFADSFNNNEVLLYERDSGEFVGRVIAKGGDTIDISEDGKLIINGYEQESEVQRADSEVTYPITLSDGEYFILCDNRSECIDSRQFGPITAEDVKGLIFSIIRKRNI